MKLNGSTGARKFRCASLFEVRFTEFAEYWKLNLIPDGNTERAGVGFTFTIPHQICSNRPGSKLTWQKEYVLGSNRRRDVREAYAKLEAETLALCRYFRNSPQTFAEFKAESFRFICDWMVERAELPEPELLMPVNYVAEIVTPKLLKRISRALERPRKRRKAHMKLWLIENWEHRFSEMTRFELSRLARRELHISVKPKTLWETAYRLGLESDRRPGVKPRT